MYANNLWYEYSSGLGAIAFQLGWGMILKIFDAPESKKEESAVLDSDSQSVRIKDKKLFVYG